MPTPTPLTEEEAADLAALLDAADDAEETLIKADTTLKLTRMRFTRKSRALRIAHGAGNDVVWDAAKKCWAQVPVQSPQPRAVEPLIPED